MASDGGMCRGWSGPCSGAVLRDGWKASLNDNGPSKPGGPALQDTVSAASGMVSRRSNN